MNQFIRLGVYLSRLHHSLGFGIQSPTDYAFVRYVVNEHWPYYAYDKLKDGDWLTLKLGRLYFRLANWKQPVVMLKDEYQPYWSLGCKKTAFVSQLEKVELARVSVENRQACESLIAKCDEQSVLVVEGIYRDWTFWRSMGADERVGTAFDLYYCGILFFDKKRYKFHYTINF